MNRIPRLPHGAPFLLLDQVLEVEVVRVFASAVLVRGRALVDGALRAEGRLTLALPR